ncbi:MAG: response regulator [Balneolaceae bacterium]|nr:MAG: response regulator [Balneolaceae bacterium]
MLAMQTSAKKVDHIEVKKTIRILLVEDSDDDKELILRELRRGGFHPIYHHVQTESDYLEGLKNRDLDLVLCDYSMPTFDGIRALEMLKEKECDLPFILISGAIQDEVAIEAMKEGANDYLMKGNLSKLGAVVERALRDAAVRREHKKSQILIAENVRRLREAERIAGIGNWELNHSTKRMIWSEELYRIFELHPEVDQITIDTLLQKIHPDERKRLDLAFRQSVFNREVMEMVCRVVLRDDRQKYVRIRCEHQYEMDLPVRSLGVVQDMTKTVEAQIKLEHSLEEKRVLIAEIHHRVKNNLALIFSLLQLESAEVDDKQARDILMTSVMRIRTMSLVHEKLYSIADFSAVPFRSFVKSLTGIVESNFKQDKAIKTSLDLDEIDLNVNQAIPASLILNELISNCYKHAFSDQDHGEITVSAKQDNEYVTLTVEDNGKGLSGDFSIEKESTLGLTIINLLAQQLKGELKVENSNGSRFALRFKLKKNIKGGSGNYFPSMATYLKPYRFGVLNDVL